MANTQHLLELATVDWKLPRLIESAKESEDIRKKQATAQVDAQTTQMFQKEVTAIPQVMHMQYLPIMEYSSTLYLCRDDITKMQLLWINYVMYKV